MLTASPDRTHDGEAPLGGMRPLQARGAGPAEENVRVSRHPGPGVHHVRLRDFLFGESSARQSSNRAERPVICTAGCFVA